LSLAISPLELKCARSRAAQFNVLLITADDMSAELACYGNPLVKSPNLDRLASRGMRFDRAYCQFPLCNPSRTSLLSGYRPETTGVLSNETPPRRSLGNVPFLPELFAAAGYFTGRVGKISHGDFESSVRWDVVGNVSEPPPAEECSSRDPNTGLPCTRPKDVPDEEEPDGEIARRAAALIEAHQTSSPGEPFFIAAGFLRPHIPFVCPSGYFDLYNPKQIVLPDPLRRNSTPDRLEQRTIAAYYACISFVDAQIGFLLDALDRLGLTDNTIIVFASDHGLQMGEHGIIGHKRRIFEGCVRVPLIVSVPGKLANLACPALVELVDLYPTLAALCGLRAAADLEGTDFSPLLDDPARPWKKAAFTQTRRDGENFRSVRTERYRYVEGPTQKRSQLFDYEVDPMEQTNQIRNSAYSEVVSAMKRMLAEGWRGALPPSP
jgi:uncharacterized sulfatase